MYRGRRIMAALSALLLLQLVLVESGYACGRMDGAQGAMAGMSMPASVHVGAPVPVGQQPPCRFPWAPDGCQSMAPCAPATIVPASQALSDPATPTAAIPVLAVLMPPSATSPPDLPPPRF
jgi:hypothetical protein